LYRPSLVSGHLTGMPTHEEPFKASPVEPPPDTSPALPLSRCDLLDAMQKDAGLKLSALKVDGGASVNDTLMQFQADLLGVTVQRPVVAETTALGAAYLAGLAVGYWNDQADVAGNWALQREFQPAIDDARRDALCSQWQKAVTRSLDWEPH